MCTVSVIIPTLNNELTITRAINSVLSQTYRDFEIIVVDNGSTDSTVSIVREMEINDSRINLFSTKKGRSIARNYGLSKSHGKYIQFLDSDDTLDRNKLEISVNFLNHHSDIKAYAAGVRYLSDNDQFIKEKKIHPQYKYSLLTGNLFPINSVVFRNSRITEFNSEIEYNEDWLFWVNNLYNEKVNYSQEILATVYVNENNTMGNYDLMMLYQVFVRSKIMNQFKVLNFSMFIRDIKLVILYLDLKNLKVTSNIKHDIENGPLANQIKIVKFLKKIPIMRNIFFRLATSVRKKHVY